jgi:hypothetical protein
VSWRLRNYKNRFWFQEGDKKFSRAKTKVGGADVASLPRGASAAHGEIQLSLLLLPTRVLGVRALFQFSTRSALTTIP